jgi:hypothetical protein
MIPLMEMAESLGWAGAVGIGLLLATIVTAFEVLICDLFPFFQKFYPEYRDYE